MITRAAYSIKSVAKGCRVCIGTSNVQQQGESDSSVKVLFACLPTGCPLIQLRYCLRSSKTECQIDQSRP